MAGSAGQPSAAPRLSVSAVGYRYANGTEAIEDVSLHLNAGEVVGIVGPSGGGKSTLLRLMAALLRPSTGEVTWHDDGTAGANRHFLTMMFQEETLLPWMNVLDNASLHFRFRHQDRTRAARERVQHLLAMVGMRDASGYFPSQLSGGMRRRLAFVTAVAPHPSVLLLDEPFSALDEPTRLMVHQDAMRVIRESDMACCLVTHDLAEAISLCTRILVLSSRPARVVETVEIDLGERQDMMSLRAMPEFLELYGSLWEKLREQIRR